MKSFEFASKSVKVSSLELGLVGMVMAAASPRKGTIRERAFQRKAREFFKSSDKSAGISRRKRSSPEFGDDDFEEDGDCMELVQIGAERTKNVLILMSDTGGGHRASAEAIRDAFRLEFGDEYRVSFMSLI